MSICANCHYLSDAFSLGCAYQSSLLRKFALSNGWCPKYSEEGNHNEDRLETILRFSDADVEAEVSKRRMEK